MGTEGVIDLQPEVSDHPLPLVPWRIKIMALEPSVHRVAASEVAPVASDRQVPILVGPP